METAGDPGDRGLGGDRARRLRLGRGGCGIPGEAEVGEGAADERGRTGASQSSGPCPPRPVPAWRILLAGFCCRRRGGFPRRGIRQPLHRGVSFFVPKNSTLLLLFAFFFSFKRNPFADSLFLWLKSIQSSILLPLVCALWLF